MQVSTKREWSWLPAFITRDRAKGDQAKPPTKGDLSWLPAFAVCIAVSIFFLVPLLATILGGFRSNGDLQTQPFSIPRSIQWQNFGNILKSGSLFWPALENSVLILIGTVVLLLVFA